MEILLLIFLLLINFLFAKALFNLGYMIGHRDGHMHEKQKDESVGFKNNSKKGCKNHKWKRLDNGDLECEVCGNGIRV